MWPTAGAGKRFTRKRSELAAHEGRDTSGVASAAVDLFYDPKSLTVLHRAAFEETLRDTLPEIAREDPETHEVQATGGLIFRRVEQVPKRRGDAAADQLRDGTSLADHLCSRAGELLRGHRAPRVVVRDHTEALRSMISKFASYDGSAARFYCRAWTCGSERVGDPKTGPACEEK